MVKSTEYTTPESGSSSKRKKTEDEGSNGLASKKQRTRVSFSCGECHRRKQKCDRQVPCSHCVARKVPELCKAYTPGKADQDLNARVTRLEQIIEIAWPQFSSGTTPSAYSTEPQPSTIIRPRSPSIEDETRSQTEEQEPSGGTFQSGKWYGNSVSGSVAPNSVLEQVEYAARPHFQSDGELGRSESTNDRFSTSPQVGGATPGTNVAGDDLERTAADNLKSLVQECGVSPHKISELLEELPQQRLCDILIDYYFTSINWTRYPVSEQDFRSAYSSICACRRSGGANPRDVRFLPLLFVVLAIAVRLAPENIAGDGRKRRVTSIRYYWSSRRSLLIAAAVQPDCIDIILTRLLSARFLTFDRRITECWSQLGAAVRTAQALGLHRDGSAMGMTHGTVEYRRRIWSYLYHADRSYALVLGRPNSIQDDYTSTRPPSNVDGDPQFSHLESLPLSRPTPMTFVILRHQLAEIIGKMVHHFQQVREKSHYSEVVTLDDELLRFINNLPTHYSLQPDVSLDDVHPYIPVHRFLLITEILFVRISLHRPYMLRRLNSDRFSRSRIACFESAIKDFEVRQAFREQVSKETRDSLGNAYREFQAAMIAGIYFVLEPNGPHSDSMHAILDSFMKDHEGIKEMDETTRRELKTIEFLRSKASQVETRSTPSHSRRPSKASNDVLMGRAAEQAQLLLGLQRPVTSPLPAKTQISLAATSKAASSPQSPLQRSIGHSPTMHRLHHVQPDHLHSPTTTSSPHADDESPAQSLLDSWCNNVNAPIDMASGGLPWGGAGSDLTSWTTLPYSAASTPDPRLLSGIDGSDYAYWEALVNQIQRAP